VYVCVCVTVVLSTPFRCPWASLCVSVYVFVVFASLSLPPHAPGIERDPWCVFQWRVIARMTAASLKLGLTRGVGCGTHRGRTTFEHCKVFVGDVRLGVRGVVLIVCVCVGVGGVVLCRCVCVCVAY